MSRNILLIIGALLVLLVSPVSMVHAYSWVDLGSDGTGETNSSGDMTHIWFCNDGIYAYFKEDLAGAPNTAAFTYMVYLDKPAGGSYSQDFRLVYSSASSDLQKWNGASWVDVQGITVTIGTSPNSITFSVPLSSIANPDVQQDTNVKFTNYVKDSSIGRTWVNLVYGAKEVVVGNASICNDATNLYVDIYTYPGRLMSETHLDVSKTQLQWFAPGQWPYKHTLSPKVSHDSYVVSLASIGTGQKGDQSPFGVEPGDTIFLMVHAVVGSQTAYGDAFKNSFSYTISGDTASAFISYQVIPELPWPTPLVFVPAVTAAAYVLYHRRFKRNG